MTPLIFLCAVLLVIDRTVISSGHLIHSAQCRKSESSTVVNAATCDMAFIQVHGNVSGFTSLQTCLTEYGEGPGERNSEGEGRVGREGERAIERASESPASLVGQLLGIVDKFLVNSSKRRTVMIDGANCQNGYI